MHRMRKKAILLGKNKISRLKKVAQKEIQCRICSDSESDYELEHKLEQTLKKAMENEWNP